MFKKLKIADYQLIVITDGGCGSYAYDGHKYYHCPCFEGPVTSTLGAGDAFASTLCVFIGKFFLDVPKALKAGSINSAGVISKFGATQGLMTFDEIIDTMDKNPDYQCQIIE